MHVLITNCFLRRISSDKHSDFHFIFNLKNLPVSFDVREVEVHYLWLVSYTTRCLHREVICFQFAPVVLSLVPRWIPRFSVNFILLYRIRVFVCLFCKYKLVFPVSFIPFDLQIDLKISVWQKHGNRNSKICKLNNNNYYYHYCKWPDGHHRKLKRRLTDVVNSRRNSSSKLTHTHVIFWSVY